MHLGQDIVRATTLDVPLNGLTEPFDARIDIGDLEPGGYWTATPSPGVWCADPDNEIVEMSESGNLYRVD